MAVLAGLQKHWLICVCLMLIAYSGFYIFMGNRGLPKYFYLQQELKVAQSANENYEQQRKQLSERLGLPVVLPVRTCITRFCTAM